MKTKISAVPSEMPKKLNPIKIHESRRDDMKRTLLLLAVLLLTGASFAKKKKTETVVAPEPPKVYNLVGTAKRVGFNYNTEVHVSTPGGNVDAYCNVRSSSVDCDSASGGVAVTLQGGAPGDGEELLDFSNGVLSDPRQKLFAQATSAKDGTVTFKYRLGMSGPGEYMPKTPVAVFCMPSKSEFEPVREGEVCYELEDTLAKIQKANLR